METKRLTENATFLRARDPSIIAFNRPGLIPMNLNFPELIEEENDQGQEDNNIRVYLRVKKTNSDFRDFYEIKDNVLSCKVPECSNFGRNVREGETIRKIYTFSKILEPTITQADLFNYVVKPKVLEFINGQNSTLLTYGASGSGKTFTVIGTDEEPGVVPRCLEYLFRTLPPLVKYPTVKPLPAGDVITLSKLDQKREKLFTKSLLNASTSVMDKTQHTKIYMAMQQRLSDEPCALLDDTSNVSLSVWVSFAEIYNEQIYDLLQHDPPRGKQRPRLRLGTANNSTYIKHLTYINVSSGLEAYQILQYGLHNLNYAATNLNSHSSRSHSIFTIKLVQTSAIDSNNIISNFNFCDLAGSERSKKTMNVGDRLKESNNINSSLLVLGRCISAVRSSQKSNDQKLVPYRESKLTQLFQKALAGFEDIAMIVTISPLLEMFDETLHVLNFSAIVKEITVDRREIVTKKKKNRFSVILDKKRQTLSQYEDGTEMADLETLRNEVVNLQHELEMQRIEAETNEKLNHEYFTREYEKIIHDIRENHARILEDNKALLRRQYENKIQNLKVKYENRLEEQSQNCQIIQLDTSSDGDNEEIESLNKVIDELKEQLAFSKTDNKDKQKLIEELAAENGELKATINDAMRDYLELENKYKKETENFVALRNENIVLKHKIDELEVEVKCCRNEYTEFLSDKDSNTEDHDLAAGGHINGHE